MNLIALKNVVIIITLLALSYSAVQVVKVYDRSSEPTNFRKFSVHADASVYGIPDVARISFGVITEGAKDIASMQNENTSKMNKIVSAVKDLGIKKEDITTQNFSINPRYTSHRCPFDSVEPCPPPEISGYEIRQSATIKIRDFEKLSEVIGSLSENGANNVSGLSFEVDDPTDLENQARAKAIEKAKEKAKDLADAGGFRVGRLLSIYDSSGVEAPYARSFAEDTKVMSLGGATIAPQIEPGSQEVRSNVTLEYEIE